MSILRSEVVASRILWMVPVLFLAAAATAQTVPATTVKSDSWAPAPAAATSASDTSAAHRGIALPEAGGKGRFKFKDSHRDGPMGEPPPAASDKAAVMGQERPWQDGRPPVSCAATPQDPSCH
jgi:hypothetical protein